MQQVFKAQIHALENFVRTSETLGLRAAEVCSSLITAGCVKTHSCVGLVPTAIRKGGGREERRNSHSSRTLPCGRSVGGEEAAWGLLRYVCARGVAGFASQQGQLLVRGAAAGLFAWNRTRFVPSRVQRDGGDRLQPGRLGSWPPRRPHAGGGDGPVATVPRRSGLPRGQLHDATVQGLGPAICSPGLSII